MRDGTQKRRQLYEILNGKKTAIPFNLTEKIMEVSTPTLFQAVVLRVCLFSGFLVMVV